MTRRIADGDLSNCLQHFRQSLMHCRHVLCVMVRSSKRVSVGCGCTPTHRGRLLYYFILLLAATVLAIVLRYTAGGSFNELYYPDIPSCTTPLCVAYGAVFRVSFATFAFFLTHAILLLLPSCRRVDQFSWLPKLVYFCFLLVLSYVLPDPFYIDGYLHVSRVVGGIFLFLQIVILVDLAHTWNEKWAHDDAVTEERLKWMRVGVVVVSLLMLCASIVILVFLFIWFGDSGCHLQKFFISFTLACTFLITLLCVSERFSEKGGLLPAATVTLYCYWLLYSALASDPSSCNPFASGENDSTEVIIGLVVGALSISYAGWSTGTHSGLFGSAEEEAAKNVESKAAGQHQQSSHGRGDTDSTQMTAVSSSGLDPEKGLGHIESPSGDTEQDDSEYALVAKRNFTFHLVMAACGMYMSMLLTNWGSDSLAAVRASADGDSSDDGVELSGQGAYDVSLESMWIKIASQWLTMILFAWSVIAPVVCTSRQF